MKWDEHKLTTRQSAFNNLQTTDLNSSSDDQQIRLFIYLFFFVKSYGSYLRNGSYPWTSSISPHFCTLFLKKKHYTDPWSYNVSLPSTWYLLKFSKSKLCIHL